MLPSLRHRALHTELWETWAAACGLAAWQSVERSEKQAILLTCSASGDLAVTPAVTRNAVHHSNKLDGVPPWCKLAGPAG